MASANVRTKYNLVNIHETLTEKNDYFSVCMSVLDSTCLLAQNKFPPQPPCCTLEYLRVHICYHEYPNAQNLLTLQVCLCVLPRL